MTAEQKNLSRRRTSGTVTPNRDRATIARLAAHERWARVRDRGTATAPARAAAEDRFIAEARRVHPGLPEAEILKRAGNLRSAHAIRAARARWDHVKREPRTEAGDAASE